MDLGGVRTGQEVLEVDHPWGASRRVEIGTNRVQGQKGSGRHRYPWGSVEARTSQGGTQRCACPTGQAWGATGSCLAKKKCGGRHLNTRNWLTAIQYLQTPANIEEKNNIIKQEERGPMRDRERRETLNILQCGQRPRPASLLRSIGPSIALGKEKEKTQFGEGRAPAE